MKRITSLLLILVCAVSVSLAANDKKSKKTKGTYVEITTDYGAIVIRLYDETPLHKAQFLKLVNEHFYDSLLFHRVIETFMIQGGDPTSKYAPAGAMLGSGEGPGGRIPAEFNPALIHKKGALAAARDGNPEKASSNCQFYIVQGKVYTDAELDQVQRRNGMSYTPEQRELYKTIGGTPTLDNNYTVYGEVVSGIAVVDQIAAVKTLPGDRPEKDVRMNMKVLKKYKEKKAKRK